MQASTVPILTLSTLHRFSLMASPSNLRHHIGRHAFNLPSCFNLADCHSRQDSHAGFAAGGQSTLDKKTYANDDQMRFPYSMPGSIDSCP